MEKEGKVNGIKGLQIPDSMVTNAIKQLDRLARSRKASDATKLAASKAILSASIQLAAMPVAHGRTASDMSLGELEQEIAKTRDRLKLVDG